MNLKLSYFGLGAVILILASCSTESNSQKAHQSETSEIEEKISPPNEQMTTTASAIKAAPKGKYRMSFWYRGDGTDNIAESGEIQLDGHPCGIIHFLDIDKIPDFTDDAISATDRALEYNSSGEIIQHWRLGTDEKIVGVVDDKIVITYLNYWLAIAPNGNITEIRSFDTPELTYENACPLTVANDFAPSAYLQCISLIDPLTNNLRYLAYEGPCT